MSDGVVQLHDDGPGKKVDASLLTVGGQSVYRQRVEIHSDATTPPSVKITDGAGTVNTKQLGTAVTTSDVGLITNSVIHGLSTAGGGGFVDAKVTPSGALVTAATIANGDDVALGSTTDAAVATDTTGTISGKLRGIVKLLVEKLTVKLDPASSLPAGTNTIGAINFHRSNTSAFDDLVSVPLLPITQGNFVYGLNNQIWQYNYIFTVTSPVAAPSAGDIYSVTNAFFTVIYSNGTTLVCSGTQNPAAATGSLTRVTGSGSTPIAFSAWTTGAGVNFGTGPSITTSSGVLNLTTGATTSGNYSYLVSRKVITYRAGQGNVARMTPIFANAATNCLQLFGVGTVINNAPYDGYFFGYESASSSPRFGCHHYKAGSVVSFTPTSSWMSLTSYDPSKGCPLQIQYPYLGFGDVEFYAQDPVTGRWDLVHLIQIASSSNATQVSNPAMHFVAYIRNTGVAGAIPVLNCGSFSAMLSGERVYTGPKFATDVVVSAVSTEQPLISLRNCTTFNGVPNRGLVRLNALSFTSANNSNAILRFYINQLLAGTPSWSAINGSLTAGQAGLTLTSANSIVSRDVAATGSSGGQYQFNLGIGASGEVTIDLTPYDLFISPGETMTLTGFGSANTNIGISLNWTEDV